MEFRLFHRVIGVRFCENLFLIFVVIFHIFGIFTKLWPILSKIMLKLVTKNGKGSVCIAFKNRCVAEFFIQFLAKIYAHFFKNQTFILTEILSNKLI